jgi:hypothetical protein
MPKGSNTVYRDLPSDPEKGIWWDSEGNAILPGGDLNKKDCKNNNSYMILEDGKTARVVPSSGKSQILNESSEVEPNAEPKEKPEAETKRFFKCFDRCRPSGSQSARKKKSKKKKPKKTKKKKPKKTRKRRRSR